MAARVGAGQGGVGLLGGDGGNRCGLAQGRFLDAIADCGVFV